MTQIYIKKFRLIINFFSTFLHNTLTKVYIIEQKNGFSSLISLNYDNFNSIFNNKTLSPLYYIILLAKSSTLLVKYGLLWDQRTLQSQRQRDLRGIFCCCKLLLNFWIFFYLILFPPFHHCTLYRVEALGRLARAARLKMKENQVVWQSLIAGSYLL